MQHPLDDLLRDPWRMLELVLDGPLHPGGNDATERLLSKAEVDRNTRLLDIGCGAGNSLTIAHERGAQVVGFDRNPTEARTVQGDMSTLPFRDESFDVVLGECVLCLSPSLGQTLTEIERILKPAGRLALSDVTVEGKPPDLPSPIDGLLCLDGSRERAYIRQKIEGTDLEIDDVQDHYGDLLAMRDRIQDGLEYERLINALGDRGTRLRDGARELEAAVESGRIGYVSIVATNRP